MFSNFFQELNHFQKIVSDTDQPLWKFIESLDRSMIYFRASQIRNEPERIHPITTQIFTDLRQHIQQFADQQIMVTLKDEERNQALIHLELAAKALEQANTTLLKYLNTPIPIRNARERILICYINLVYAKGSTMTKNHYAGLWNNITECMEVIAVEYPSPAWEPLRIEAEAVPIKVERGVVTPIAERIILLMGEPIPKKRDI